MNWKRHLRDLTEKLKPVTVAIERGAAIAVHLKTPSIMGAVAAASAGANALGDLLADRRGGPSWSFGLLTSRAQSLDAFQRAGAKIIAEPAAPNGIPCASIKLDDHVMSLDGTELYLHTQPDEEMLAWLRKVFDPVMPSAMKTRCVIRKDQMEFVSEGIELAPFETAQGRSIFEMTEPLLTDGPRCLLLEGRPGVGKSSMAQEIARRYLATPRRRHRVLVIENAPIQTRRGGFEVGPASYLSDELLAIAHPAVIILDDIDKVKVELGHIEMLRGACDLLLLTANNGQHDEVLDAALMRAGRVDEVFAITPEHRLRRAPFDQLDDATWLEVQEWPVSYLNEIEARLTHRAHDLRLDDLRTRVAKKTRSGDFLA